jgi:hypothetical protein
VIAAALVAVTPPAVSITFAKCTSHDDFPIVVDPLIFNVVDSAA